MQVETGRCEIMWWDGLDLRGQHQTLAGTTSAEEIYMRNLYPITQGYPCANPCPMGPSIGIGDVGELTPHGFRAITNLGDCKLPSLQNELPLLGLSDPWHDAEYLLEGDSITGGVDGWETGFVPGSGTIQRIEYRCQASEGAILAATSPAQLHTLKPHNLEHLRLWLCKNGIDLVNLLVPDRGDPLFIVTGLVTSSSWATAAYPQSREASQSPDSLVLSRLTENLPQNYRWTRTSRQATARSKASPSGLDSRGERIKDQCLFLRGFLVTPSPRDASHRARHAFETNTVQDLYPSQRINKQLLEMTDADIAITHDDDWRFGPRHPSMPDLRKDDAAAVPGNTRPTDGYRDSAKHLRRGDQPSSMGKQESQTPGPIRSVHDFRSTGVGNVASSDKPVRDREGKARAGNMQQGRRNLQVSKVVKETGAGETTESPRQELVTSSIHPQVSHPPLRRSRNTRPALHSTPYARGTRVPASVLLQSQARGAVNRGTSDGY
ncbi:hypothetical protein BKA70DRAFT_1301080 [Coprinopsis sp. MPI-PUGE-AT-0042]|nr:hypothetical protein BKA70DRAFT_1301080 [Coprinopsis sp. MPI-PUGE-AT-0042]